MDRHLWRIISLVLAVAPLVLLADSMGMVLAFDLLCLSVGLYVIVTRHRGIATSSFLSLTLPFLFITSILVLQLIPLSPALLKLLAPETWQAYRETVWELLPGVWMSLSIHFDATVRAAIHIAALWVLGATLVLLVDSHWQLLQLLRAVCLAASFWSLLIILIILTSTFGQGLLPDPFTKESIFAQNLKTSLAIWNVSFLPLLWAGFTACRTPSPRRTLLKRFRAFLNDPDTALHFIPGVAVILVLFSLLCTLHPALWLLTLSGYFLYRSLNTLESGLRRKLNQVIYRVLAGFCLLGSVGWLLLLPTLSWQTVRIVPAKPHLLDFNWLGYGLGTYRDVGANLAAGEGVFAEHWSVLAQIWSGLGLVGSLLLVVLILLVFWGGRKSVNPSDGICMNLCAGGLASLCLLLVLSGLVASWSWQAMLTGSVCLAFLVNWSRRLSHRSHGDGEGSRQTQAWISWSLCIVTSFLITVCAVFLALTAGNRLIVEPWQAVSYDQTGGLTASGQSAKTWLANGLSRLAHLDSDATLTRGQRYLLQKRDSEAREILLPLLKMRPLAANVHVAVASVSACTGNEDAARHFLTTKAVKNYRPDETTERLVTRLLDIPESDSATRLIALALQQSPQTAGRYISLMQLYGHDPLSLQTILPAHPRVLLALGDLLAAEGPNETADNLYRSAIFQRNAAAAIDEGLYIHVASYFSASQRIAEALIIVDEGRKNYPGSQRLKDFAAGLRTQFSQ